MKYFFILCTAIITFACGQLTFADDVVKEETTPPPAEGALSAEQTPPIMDIGKRLPAPPVTNHDNS